jgi:hypothetical protein
MVEGEVYLNQLFRSMVRSRERVKPERELDADGPGTPPGAEE